MPSQIIQRIISLYGNKRARLRLALQDIFVFFILGNEAGMASTLMARKG